MRRFAVLVAASLLAAGCTDDGTLELREADPAAQPGGVLRIATTLPGSVDPGNVYEPAGELVVRTMCTPLLTTDPETSQLLPGVAESYLVTDAGRSITLRLRDDVVFSDGTPVTARDVAFTLSRIASADYASTSAERLAPIVGYQEVHGEVPTDEDLDRERLSGVQARDDQNVEINLVAPLADFVRVLASPLLAPVSRDAAQRDPEGFGRNPVCVGPYRLEAPYAPGARSLRLVRSEAYPAVDSARTRGGRGYADAIEFTFSAEPDAADVDVAPAAPGETRGVQAGPGQLVEYLGLPVTMAAFEDPRVRQAVALALDREELVRRVFPGTRVPADGFLPETSQDDDDCSRLQTDVAAAQALLTEAGADVTGVRVPLYFNDELRNRELVTEIARQLRVTLGLLAVPTPMTYAEYLAKAADPQGFDGMFRFSWAVPYSDVDGYLHPLFSTDRIGRDNLSRFSDPALDRALNRIAREAEEDADRTLGYARVTELLCELQPMVPLTTSLSRWRVADRIGTASGQFVDGSNGQLLVRELYVRR